MSKDDSDSADFRPSFDWEHWLTSVFRRCSTVASAVLCAAAAESAAQSQMSQREAFSRSMKVDAGGSSSESDSDDDVGRGAVVGPSGLQRSGSRAPRATGYGRGYSSSIYRSSVSTPPGSPSSASSYTSSSSGTSSPTTSGSSASPSSSSSSSSSSSFSSLMSSSASPGTSGQGTTGGYPMAAIGRDAVYVPEDETEVLKDFVDSYGGDDDDDSPGFPPPPPIPESWLPKHADEQLFPPENPQSLLYQQQEYSFDDEPVFKEGWLTKEGRIHRNWKLRMFVLQGSKLSYYTAHKRKWKGSLALETCAVKAVERAGRDALALITEGRTLYFMAPTKLQSEDWVTAIQNKISWIQYVKKMKALRRAPDLRIRDIFADTFMSSIKLESRPMSIETVVALSQPLKSLSFLHTLALSRSNLDSLSLSVLSSCIRASKTLKVLDLSFNDISDVRDFAGVLAANASLECLRIDNNPLGDRGVANLAAAIRQHRPALSFVSWDGTKCTDQGLQAILDLFPLRLPGSGNEPFEYPPWTILSVSNNEITARGAECIGEVIRKCHHSLEILSLSHNKIGSEGCSMLCERGLPRIAVLDVSHNDIGYAGLRSIAGLLELETVSVGGNRINEQVLREIFADRGPWHFPEIELVL